MSGFTKIYKNRLFICKSTVKYSTKFMRPLILGIETSCDDTGAALIDRTGTILGEHVCSQQKTHLKYGGIIPPVAQDLHRKNIENVVNTTLRNGGLTVQDIDAIAVTNRPGLPLSLLVGVRYAKHLGRMYSKPLIPIHHMEAHALAVRLETKIPFPFLTLLCSGGHCLLAIVKNVNEFYLMGETLDDAPGEALDKIARRLRLRNIPEYQWLSGGESIEKAALLSSNSTMYEFPLPLARHRDCMFSFAGLKNTAQRHIKKDELDYKTGPDEVIPNYKEFCLDFLKSITRHIAHRTQRAIEFCERGNLLGDGKRFLVISGGCACNDFLFYAIKQMAETFCFETVRPQKRFCTDNGVMIAWNGVEKHLANIDVIEEINEIDIDAKCKLGINIADKISESSISCKWVKIPLMSK